MRMFWPSTIMKFRIHGTCSDETNDYVDIVGDTIEEIRRKAEEEVSRRGWTNPWSDRLEEDVNNQDNE